MMNKGRFIWLLKNSVKITTEEYPNSIFYYMNYNIERQIKLHTVLDINEPIKFDINNIDKTNLLFEQDTKNKRLWYDYENILIKLKSNNDYKNLDISTLIGGWLNDNTNWKVYTPIYSMQVSNNQLNDDTNWKVYSPYLEDIIFAELLNDDTNWKVYTPNYAGITYNILLTDDTNWKIK